MPRFQPSNDYITRLTTEHALVKRYTPNFKLRRDCDGRYHYDGWQHAQSGSRYRLRLSLDTSYPYAKPRLLLINPAVVPVYGGDGVLNTHAPSHQHHLDGPVSHQHLAVCFTGNWHANKTCVSALIAGVIWVECLDRYQRTGECIASQIDAVKAELNRGNEQPPEADELS